MMTIGYEGLTLDTFVNALLSANVETLVDVREVPLSRKRGFSKSALNSLLSAYGIQYLHVVQLGCPRKIRYDYRIDKDWARYTNRFLSYLDTQEVVLSELTTRSQHEECCLLCFEADYTTCHRMYIAERIATAANLSVIHLMPQKVATVLGRPVHAAPV